MLKIAIQAAPAADPQIASAKRTALERKGLHAWHPYYAGYSEAFVDSAIRYLGATERSLVLDPWGGSGTTGVISSRCGVPSLCLDINPVMTTFAAAKSATVLDFRIAIEGFVRDLSKSHQKRPDPSPSNQRALFNRGFDAETASAVAGLVTAIATFGERHIAAASPGRKILGVLKKPRSIQNPACAFLMSALFVTLRKLAGPKRRTNPTWVTTSDSRTCLSFEELARELSATTDQMLSDVRSFYQDTEVPARNYALLGDTRNMPFKNSTVDYVITSPPYLTRIDYAISTSPELALLGDETLTSAIRHDTMGAPVITKALKHQKDSWGQTCNDILDTIAAHQTKAARSYYWKNIVQYFMDMEAALKDIHRVLRKDGQALIVVQSSYFKELELPLGDLYVEMARNFGFDSCIAFREEVRGHMAHVNTKSSKYAKNKVYLEDVVHLRKHAPVSAK